jgi:hypothetical protein
MVSFTVVSAPEHHSCIESVIQRVCSDGNEFAPVLQSLEVRVSLFIKADGEPVKEYALAKSAPAEATKAKPWWRFW